MAVGCRLHGHRWLREETNICLAPGCLQGLVLTIMRRPGGGGLRRAWGRYQAIGLDQDFLQHIAFYLLSTPEVRHVNATVMRIICDRFSNQGYQPKQEYHTNYTREFLDATRLDEQTAMTRHELIGEAMDRATVVASPYVTALLREVALHLDDPELMLMLAGTLEPQDVARLKSADGQDVLELAQQLREQLPMLHEWVRQYGGR